MSAPVPHPGQATNHAGSMKLGRETLGGPLSKREPPKLAVRRRQLLLLDEFRASRLTDEPTALPSALDLPEFAAERTAWDAALPSPGADSSPSHAGFTDEARFVCEEAALSVSGDFAHDPIVAYSLACYRAVLFASYRGSPS